MSARDIVKKDPADFTPTLGNYNDLQPFRFWCQKVLPLVYDDSLSYYELLCKVVDYLNKTLEDVDVLEGDVTGLHEAYKKLQGYVNDYFSTLDVQKEINNKLNIMSIDGTLSVLIAPFITQNSNPIFVDNVSDMKEHNKTYVLSANGHIYTYKNGNFVDSGLSYNFNNKDYILTNVGFEINDDYLTDNQDVNITTLTINTFYRVNNITQEHALQLGLKNGMGRVGSLYITKPSPRTDKSSSFKLIEWITGNRTASRRYFAYMYSDDTIDTIVWHTAADMDAVNSLSNRTILCDYGFDINDAYMKANPNTSVLTLETNTLYRVGNLSDANYDKLGFRPDMRGPGTITILKPWGKTNYTNLSYRYIEYVVGSDMYTRKYFAFCYGSETIDTLYWRKIETTGAKEITNMGKNANKIYLIGDSIVEGYGGTNYNGGSSQNHSDEEIPNNVKTWYRNTTGTCWANMLKNYIENNYPNTTVVNNGIGGLNCQQVNDNFDTLVPEDATMVIISCGTNDRNNNNKNSAITSNITEMIKKANRRGLKCVILTNSPLRESVGKAPNNAQTINAYINNSIKLNNALNIQVLSNMLSYMDLNNLSVNAVTNDALHPNDIGYKIMFNIIRAELGL